MMTDPSAARRHIRHRSERAQRREVRRAIRRLEALGPVTDEQRDAVEALASSLAHGLLEPAEQRLDAPGANEKSVAAIARLYG